MCAQYEGDRNTLRSPTSPKLEISMIFWNFGAFGGILALLDVRTPRLPKLIFFVPAEGRLSEPAAVGKFDHVSHR